jgi:hypothetical protein
MKADFDFSPTPGHRLRQLASASLAGTRRAVALVLMWLMIPLGIGDVYAWSQEAPPPPPDQQDQGPPPDDQGAPPQQWNALSPDQLDQLVAPIALYPDSLVAQVLAAATYPTQVVDADRFVQANAGAPPDQIADMANNQSWDPSVKALTAFPSVLSNLDRNLDWTTQLGNAYYNQPQDVMGAVQNMRQQAYEAGHLRSTPQLNVDYQPDDIAIEPANPTVVYVPYYDPWVMWGFHPYYAWYAPPPPRGFVVGVGIGFGVGVAVGAFTHWGWGWGHWNVGWGPHPVIMHEHVTYVSRSVTVVNHGYYGRFDRHPEARQFNMHAAAGARASYNRGYAAGQRNDNNRGAANGFNRGDNNANRNNNFNRPQNNNNRPAQNNNFNRQPNNNRPQNFNQPNPRNNPARPPQNNNLNRPAQNNNYNRPAQNNNYNRPQNRPSNAQPRNESRPNNAQPRNESRPQKGGGGEKPHEHPHGR